MTKKINPNLTAEQKLILFEEGTELAGSSELNHEKREGSFHCANCGEKLFDSKSKYESGSGWPSFYCLLYTSPSPRDRLLSRMPSSA